MRRVLLLVAGVGLLSLIPVLAWAAPSNGNWFSSTAGHGEVVNMDGGIWQFNFETVEDGTMFAHLAMFEEGADEPTCDAHPRAHQPEGRSCVLADAAVLVFNLLEQPFDLEFVA